MPPPQAKTTSVPPHTVVHLGGDVIVGLEGAGVPILDVDIRQIQLLGSLVRAHDEAIPIPDHRGHVNTAQEAQLFIAFLHSSVASQITGLLFLVADEGDIRGNGLGLQVAFGHIQSQEQNLGMLRSHGVAGRAPKQGNPAMTTTP